MANVNQNLTAAKNAKNDEFYTQYDDIQHELNAYLEYDSDTFKDKTVLLPCDDPEWSNFTKFFAANFEFYGLKKLISTSYAADSKKINLTNGMVSLFEQNSPQFDAAITNSRGKIFTVERADYNKYTFMQSIKWNYLEGDGDFRSDEVRKLRDEADVIITNPPFSLFREFLAWIMAAKKEFLIIASQNCITYKKVFPLIKENKIWLGRGFSSGNAYFKVPKEYIDSFAEGVYNPKTDLVKLRNLIWLTNLEHGRRHTPMILRPMAKILRFTKHKEIAENGFRKYDNYDAIEVPFTDSIPSDYDGAMGVPITFLDKYCPEQFEILDARDFALNERQKNKNTYLIKDADGAINGKPTYARILIRRRQ